MSDTVSISGKEYISSKRAAELSGYAQDYIGQLARKALIDAQRIGGLWYVSLESLYGYKRVAEEFKPLPPRYTPSNDPETLLSFDGKDYMSASRAASITGYNQDYVGQLARSGKVLSRQVGNRWYVEREGILEHKKEKDALLAAVQAESVGLQRPQPIEDRRIAASEPYFNYVKDERDLLPVLAIREEPKNTPQAAPAIENRVETHQVPIRVVSRNLLPLVVQKMPDTETREERTRGGAFYGTLAASALTVVIVLTFGFSSIQSNALYVFKMPDFGSTANGSATASAAQAFDAIGQILENLLVPELTFRRTE